MPVPATFTMEPGPASAKWKLAALNSGSSAMNRQQIVVVDQADGDFACTGRRHDGRVLG